MAYEDIVPIGTVLIVASVSFVIGTIYGNLPYDFFVLFSSEATEAHFDAALKHYQLWGSGPAWIIHILHFVVFLGFTGCFIKIYKPVTDIKLFEYGSLFALLLATCVYLTNIRVGVESAVSGIWGDIDQNTGLGVIVASELMVLVLLVGVLVLQAGMYYATYADRKIKEEYLKGEAEEKAAAKAAKTKPTATSTGVETRSKSKKKV
ncbi:unnamed protein product [Kuraishia capsulata CBS 1993]|uniref:Shr3 amino acid permease chaperone n=1 Tax=Kuraishia capsulata CBS 1993 TaxID=1382522 RepID=W6MQ72_9ASCO|nr:uncharacterized protein KUCA_T00004821001 [Kuraishia capsulata CBS 1993]CDK28836.1 unnamed protein product [Kuraishia capsulata CBS 1993]